MPTNVIANGVSYIFDKMTGNTYVPMIAQSGFNPFGYAKDLAKGNIGNLLMRGIDAYATLGAPGLAEGIDYLGTRFAPKQEVFLRNQDTFLNEQILLVMSLMHGTKIHLKLGVENLQNLLVEDLWKEQPMRELRFQE